MGSDSPVHPLPRGKATVGLPGIVQGRGRNLKGRKECDLEERRRGYAVQSRAHQGIPLDSWEPAPTVQALSPTQVSNQREPRPVHMGALPTKQDRYHGAGRKWANFSVVLEGVERERVLFTFIGRGCDGNGAIKSSHRSARTCPPSGRRYNTLSLVGLLEPLVRPRAMVDPGFRIGR